MRALDDAPSSVIEPRTTRPAFGSYQGPIARMSLYPLSRGPLDRIARQKRWLQGSIVTETHFVGFGVVDVGYAVSAFAYVLTRVDRRMQVDRSLLSLPFASRVRRTDALPYGARLRHPLGTFRIERYAGEEHLSVDVEVGRLEIHASLDCESGPPPLTAVTPAPDHGTRVTERRVLCPVKGDARIQGIRHRLDDGLGAYEFTQGFLPRRTTQRRAFLMGRSRAGDPVALSLADGASGEAESALWVGRSVYGVGEGRFEHDGAYPLSDWRVSSRDGAADLRFAPWAMHAERRHAGVISTRFVQPVGTYAGHVRVPGGPSVELDDVMGVTEAMDARW